MPIIDHRNYHKPKNQLKPIQLGGLLTAIACTGLLIFLAQRSKQPTTSVAVSPLPSTGVQSISPTPTSTPKPTKLKQFSGLEFRKLYETFAYPNTQEVTTYPVITGNAIADQKIRALAMARGYMQRSVPVSSMAKIENGYLLQQRAATSWETLKTAAAKAGLRLGLTAAFRSPEDQRTLFMERFKAAGLTPEMVAAAAADQQVTELLKITAIPGFSRHHTGYTVDISCESNRGVIFENSDCYKWLSANNYQHAKEAGWIPSYPPGAGDQGPNPEAWEYVWVGMTALREEARI